MNEAKSGVNGTMQTKEDPIYKEIEEHAKAKLSLSASDMAISEVFLKDLPSGVRQFTVQEKNKSGASSINYLVYEKSLYCSRIDDDFARFLKDYKFLERSDADGETFRAILWKLNNFENMLVITRETLSSSDEDLEPFLSKIAEPKLTKSLSGLNYKFYTQTVNVIPVQKIEVIVSPQYEVTFKREFVSK